MRITIFINFEVQRVAITIESTSIAISGIIIAY